MEPELGHLLVLTVSQRPGFNSEHRTLILLIKHLESRFPVLLMRSIINPIKSVIQFK